MHPRRLRCSSLKYSRYSRSSRLAGGAGPPTRLPRWGPRGGAPNAAAALGTPGRLARLGATPDFHHGLLGGEPVVLIEFDFEDDTVHRLGTPGAHVHP